MKKLLILCLFALPLAAGNPELKPSSVTVISGAARGNPSFGAVSLNLPEDEQRRVATSLSNHGRNVGNAYSTSGASSGIVRASDGNSLMISEGGIDEALLKRLGVKTITVLHGTEAGCTFCGMIVDLPAPRDPQPLRAVKATARWIRRIVWAP